MLIKNEQSTKYGNTAYSGPYTVTSVNDNGTLYVNKGIVTDVINIRNVHPYVLELLTSIMGGYAMYRVRSVVIYLIKIIIIFYLDK